MESEEIWASRYDIGVKLTLLMVPIFIVVLGCYRGLRVAPLLPVAPVSLAPRMLRKAGRRERVDTLYRVDLEVPVQLDRKHETCLRLPTRGPSRTKAKC